MPIPREYGRGNADPITTIAMMESLGYGGSDQGLLFSINAHMWTSLVPLLKCGTEQLDFTHQPRLGQSAVMPLNH
jgi:alkylation response protein AidB-like acyl-CoA dehydrogenase